MSEQEQKAFKMYGKLPAKNHLTKMQKVSGPSVVSFPLHLLCPRETFISGPCSPQERRYFDSAEYQLQKSGHGGGQVVGREIPTPQA